MTHNDSVLAAGRQRLSELHEVQLIFSIPEAAIIAQRSPQSLYRDAKRGRLQIFPGGKVSISALRAYLGLSEMRQ